MTAEATAILLIGWLSFFTDSVVACGKKRRRCVVKTELRRAYRSQVSKPGEQVSLLPRRLSIDRKFTSSRNLDCAICHFHIHRLYLDSAYVGPGIQRFELKKRHGSSLEH